MRRAGSSSGASMTRGKQQEANAPASTRTAGDSGAERLSRNVSGPSGLLVVIVTPMTRGMAGRLAGKSRVVIVTAISPAGPSSLADRTPCDSVAAFTGAPCGSQPS